MTKEDSEGYRKAEHTGGPNCPVCKQVKAFAEKLNGLVHATKTDPAFDKLELSDITWAMAMVLGSVVGDGVKPEHAAEASADIIETFLSQSARVLMSRDVDNLRIALGMTEDEPQPQDDPNIPAWDGEERRKQRAGYSDPANLHRRISDLSERTLAGIFRRLPTSLLSRH